MPAFDVLANLPDRPALEQLSRALWSRGTLRGAAVLVGAGVSRSGARLLSADTPLPPLWSDLANEMARELYGALAGNAPRDPLRLAEEFRSGLGDAALTDFLRRRIRDDAFEPGQIHRDLLDLPWSDVLTTNYDSLLERAAKDARHPYDLVLTENDLAHARGPRIIKLHGSLRDGAGVVISEEDYRTYPQRQAAFVNTARQVFIENELCLLGFSGDDPNFLQWAGWVRDRLGGRARRIYLVGALDLPPVKRRLLESRGVAIIDLAPAVAEERADRRHGVAVSLFLAHLKAARPIEPDDWKPTSFSDYPNQRGNDHHARSRDFRDSEKVTTAFRATLELWRTDRETCPNWLICPRGVRLSIRHGTDTVDNLSLALDALPEKERRDALLELAWRFDRGAQPLPQWLVGPMDAISTSALLSEADPELISALARVLLGAARAADDAAALAARAQFFEALTAPGDLPALVAHERCLFARDRLDFAFVAENANKVDGDDPMWGLRRAALLYWVGETDEARKTIEAAARELRTRVLRDPDSVALRSRLAWTRTLARALSSEGAGALLAELDGEGLALRNYDPWEQLRALDADVYEGLRKRSEARDIEPGFEAGSYRDNGDTLIFGSAAHVAPFSELRHITERAGLPIRTRYVNMLATRLADALRLAFEPTATWHATLLSTKPNHSKGSIDIHLGRISVARLSADVVAELRRALEHGIGFWRARVQRRANIPADVDTLRLYVEALSRIAVRDDAETAKAHVRLAVEMGSDQALNYWWLNEPIGHLLKRAFEAVPANERGELSSELLRFPLAAEREAGGPSMSWYDPGPDAYRFVRRSGSEPVFDARVAAFIHHLAIGGRSRPEAAVRLLYLYENEQLTSDQIAAFAETLWKDVPRNSNALPEGTHLLLHAFVIAPAPQDIDAPARVYAQLFAAGAEAAPEHMEAAVSGRAPHLQPQESDAIRLFRNAAKWRPADPAPVGIGNFFARPAREKSDRRMASVLGIVAAPALAKHDLTVELAKDALAFLDETGLPEALDALPVFYDLNSEVDGLIVNAFRRTLAIGDRRATLAAVNAMDRWLRLTEGDRASPLPDILRDRALRALERGRAGGLVSLVHLARRLVEAGRCGDPELDRIVEVLDELREATNYGDPEGDADVETDRAVSLPVVRAECVRLARALEQRGVTTEPVRIWRDLAAGDPLPEVRNAASRAAED